MKMFLQIVKISVSNVNDEISYEILTQNQVMTRNIAIHCCVC